MPPKSLRGEFLARQMNAFLLTKKLGRLIDEGHFVIDGQGQVVTGVWFENRDVDGAFEFGYKLSENHRVVLFIASAEWDNGAHTPISDFNAFFDNWKIIHPKDFIKLAASRA